MTPLASFPIQNGKIFYLSYSVLLYPASMNAENAKVKVTANQNPIQIDSQYSELKKSKMEKFSISKLTQP